MSKIELLIKYGANIDATYDYGYTLLNYAYKSHSYTNSVGHIHNGIVELLKREGVVK